MKDMFLELAIASRKILYDPAHVYSRDVQHLKLQLLIHFLCDM